MLLALKIKTAIVAAVFAASPVAVSVLAPAGQKGVEAPMLVELKPGTLRYFASGEFTRDGKPVDAPETTIRIRRAFMIMKDQVSVAEYQRCVIENACVPLAPEAATRPGRPAVMVSWRDAQSYAQWLSRKTGVRYRLPSDEEWTYAAGSRAPNESPAAGTGSDAVDRWLSRYERESRRQPVNPVVMPLGSFGVNENGLADVGGNVWEWTDTCFTRSAVDGGRMRVVMENCGVRVVEGAHRTYISDFIRDARGGGCAVGTPPSNLGFRLIRDDTAGWLSSLKGRFARG
jgi:formylglycine-generating enzyme required for sulfatase activity